MQKPTKYFIAAVVLGIGFVAGYNYYGSDTITESDVNVTNVTPSSDYIGGATPAVVTKDAVVLPLSTGEVESDAGSTVK